MAKSLFSSKASTWGSSIGIKPAMLVKNCDKGFGPALVSRSIYNSQLELHLRDITYVKLTNTTFRDVVLLMHGVFQECVRKFRNEFRKKSFLEGEEEDIQKSNSAWSCFKEYFAKEKQLLGALIKEMIDLWKFRALRRIRKPTFLKEKASSCHQR